MNTKDDVFARAERDMQRGNFALARSRLESFLDHKGYDPELLERIGKIAAEMHDPASAGRFWITSTAQGTDVEAAIVEFVRRCGSSPPDVASRLPRAARLDSLERYPPIVRTRLGALNLADAVVAAGKRQHGIAPPVITTWGGRFLEIIFFGILLLTIGSCIVGVGTIADWMFE